MDYSFLTDIGNHPTNEDCFICKKISPTCMLAGVIDGCGAAGGAAEIVRDKLLGTVLQMSLSDDAEVLLKQLKTATVEVNNYLVDYRRHAPKVGCCVITICIVDWDSKTISLVHCGDTRAYMLTKEGLTQKTKDDSYIGGLLQAGSITESEAQNNPMRHLIFKSIGSEHIDNESNYVSATTMRFLTGDRLLICTDGVYDTLREYEIKNIIERDNVSIQDKLNTLLTLAREGGSTDNATAILIKL